MREFRLLGVVLLMATFMTFIACSDSATGPGDRTGDKNGENGSGGGEPPTYNVSVNVLPSDGGTVLTADTTVEEGEEVDIQADPSTEYNFSHWSGDVESTGENPLSLTVSQDYKIVANFQRKSYELTVNTEGKGAVTEEVLEQKSKDYEHGTVVELIAKPEADWKFVEWKGAKTGSENPIEITVDDPKEVTAVFEKREYDLTIKTSGEGAVQEEVVQEKTSSYEAGTVIEFTFKPAKGWRNKNYSTSEGLKDLKQISTEPDNYVVQYRIDTTATLTANFERKEYTLLVQTEGPGKVTGMPDDQPKYNEKIELTGEPRDERHQFAEWKGDISSEENPVTITMNSDKEITGVFEDATHELTINTEGEGEVVEENLMAKSYELGTNVKLTAKPDQGWAFEQWQGDLSGSQNPVQVTATEPKEVTAVFGEREIKITQSSSEELHGKLGTTLPVEVRVTDQADNAVSDITVDYTVTEGNGTISPMEVTTDNNGYAAATLQLPDEMKSTTVKVQIQSAPYTIKKKEVTFKANTLTELDEWLNNHETIADVINWKVSWDSTASYGDWTEETKNDLNETYFKVINNNLDTDQYPPENQYSDSYNSSYPTMLSEEDAWRLYLMNIAHSLAVERNNVVNWSVLSNDYSKEDLRVLFDGRVMFSYQNGGEFKVASSQKDNLPEQPKDNFVPVGYGRVMPSHPQMAMEFFNNKNIIGDTRKETIYRLIDWSTKLRHFTGSFSSRQNIRDHWGYVGAVPINKIIDGTDYKDDDAYEIEHFTAGCHGTNDFYISILRNLNIPVRYVRKGGHSTPHFTVDDLYLSHGDDPYNQMYALKPVIHPQKLLINQQTWNDWFANKSYDEAQQNIGRTTTILGLEHLSYYLLDQYCEDQSRGRSKENGDVYEALSRFYSLSELKDMNLWQKLDDKLSEIGGCKNVDLERPTYYQH